MTADLVLAAIILINSLVGFRRGLINMLGRLAIFLVSLVLTLLMVSPLAAWLANLPALEPAVSRITTSVLEPLQEKAPDAASLVSSLKFPEALEKILMDQMPEKANDLAEAFPDLSASILRFAITAVLFIIFFALINIVIHVITRSLTKVSDKVPVLGVANRLAGLAAGLAFGLLQIIILLLLAGLLAPYIPAIGDIIANSQIAEYFYTNNFLNRFI